MATIEELEQEIQQLKRRNRRVESEKAWETSATRKILVAILTYIVVAIFFKSAQIPRPLVNALVPTAAFLLSTLSIPPVKRYWIKKIGGKSL